jgi:hypothetical protein
MSRYDIVMGVVWGLIVYDGIRLLTDIILGIISWIVRKLFWRNND